MKFCITGLPRSRTAWFSAYFTACGYKCAHEGMNGCESIVEYLDRMSMYEGNSDCGCVFYPHQKTVIIERDAEEVKKSLSRLFDDVSFVDLCNEKMKKIDGLRVKFEDIDERLQEIHEFCVGKTYNTTIAEQFKNMKITIKNINVDNKSVKMLGELLWRG